MFFFFFPSQYFLLSKLLLNLSIHQKPKKEQPPRWLFKLKSHLHSRSSCCKQQWRISWSCCFSRYWTKIDGENCIFNCLTVMMFICSKEKDDHHNGAVPWPVKEDLNFRIWKTKNNVVTFCLINLLNNIGLAQVIKRWVGYMGGPRFKSSIY